MGVDAWRGERERAREEDVVSLLSREWIRRRRGLREGGAGRRKVGRCPRTESVFVAEQLRAAMNLPPVPLHSSAGEAALNHVTSSTRGSTCRYPSSPRRRRLHPSSSVSFLLLPSHAPISSPCESRRLWVSHCFSSFFFFISL